MKKFLSHIKLGTQLAGAALVAVIFGALSAQARVPSPFKLSASLDTNAAAPTVVFAFVVPPNHMLYAEHLHFFNAQGDELTPSKIPVPVTAVDPITGHEKHFYNEPFAASIIDQDHVHRAAGTRAAKMRGILRDR